MSILSYEKKHKMREKIGKKRITKSILLETGKISPEEFVLAGDNLVFKCPTWRWATCSKSKQNDWLPSDKQFLITEHVPCLKRAHELTSGLEKDFIFEDEGGDSWISPENLDELPKKKEEEKEKEKEKEKKKEKEEEKEEEKESSSDEEVMINSNEKKKNTKHFEKEQTIKLNIAIISDEEVDIVKSRTYNITITYDKYYQTPRVWLQGYREDGQQLTTKEMSEDISPDHFESTVTFVPHPHLEVKTASIHPCKHAHVMKRMIDEMGTRNKVLESKNYLLLFLKFIFAAIPTINFDFSQGFEL
ncbi:ubiquitin-like-conjugating enzyme atg3 [Anaeramoeba flamelloides]|uniref:Ubiquitin-like-conjugating enzyme atg3 n=1 Tax=Anaeramoeba flamelloides TaxID=1746091 RepID=A0AAV7YHC7_9EUKA|nr:ubiquitin-like-conjugating enzyme atg3 [Anaeramoeba flamelloides]